MASIIEQRSALDDYAVTGFQAARRDIDAARFENPRFDLDENLIGWLEPQRSWCHP
jgi:hypothetical protein